VKRGEIRTGTGGASCSGKPPLADVAENFRRRLSAVIWNVGSRPGAVISRYR
jgi:hypothetical protein